MENQMRIAQKKYQKSDKALESNKKKKRKQKPKIVVLKKFSLQ